MKCPACPEIDLVMTERQGVEIDYCPKCRGVWLDRGELDKIIERSTAIATPPPTSVPAPTSHEGHHYPHDHHDSDHYRHGYKRRKSWLGELFD